MKKVGVHKNIIAFFLAVCLALETAPGVARAVGEVDASAPTAYEFAPGDDWTLVWHDEFDGNDQNGQPSDNLNEYGVNLNNWGVLSGDSGNGWTDIEQPYYLPGQAQVEDGQLVITMEKKSVSGRTRYYTAQLRSSSFAESYNDQLDTNLPAGGLSRTYGRFEARIQMPQYNGMLESFWMMPTHSVYGGWAASGEIDIAETMNNQNGTDYHISGTIHFGGPWPGNKYLSENYYFPDSETAGEFHVYALEWESGEFRWYCDDVLYHTETSDKWYTSAAPGNPLAPFDQDFYMNLGIDSAGLWGGSSPSAQMTVDYVRVYERTEPATGISLTGTAHSYNPNTPATIRLLCDGVEQYKTDTATTPGSGQTNQSFTFLNVVPGDYTLVVTKPGHASYTIKTVTVGDGSIDIGVITLPCGDINGDGMINDSDLAELWRAANYNKSVDDAGVNQLCDLNGDGMINDSDLAILWSANNYNKGAVVVG